MARCEQIRCGAFDGKDAARERVCSIPSEPCAARRRGATWLLRDWYEKIIQFRSVRLIRDMPEEVLLSGEDSQKQRREGEELNRLQRTAEDDAMAFLAKVQSPDSGADVVDPVALAKSLSISVYDADLPEGVSGILRKRPKARPEIYVQRSDHPRRKRFTVAHELGHMVKRQKDENYFDDDIATVDKRDDLATKGVDPGEMYANAFAAALLMPRGVMEVMVDNDFSARHMAAVLSVSLAAVSNRLKNLGLED